VGGRSLARGLTTATRPRSTLNLGVLLELVRTQLRALLGDAGSKAAVGDVLASVAVGGVVAERSLEPTTAPPARPASARTSPELRATRPASAAGAAS
jgi:hypothetical protein